MNFKDVRVIVMTEKGERYTDQSSEVGEAFHNLFKVDLLANDENGDITYQLIHNIAKFERTIKDRYTSLAHVSIEIADHSIFQEVYCIYDFYINGVSTNSGRGSFLVCGVQFIHSLTLREFFRLKSIYGN
jgi:hypothetical protein